MWYRDWSPWNLICAISAQLLKKCTACCMLMYMYVYVGPSRCPTNKKCDPVNCTSRKGLPFPQKNKKWWNIKPKSINEKWVVENFWFSHDNWQVLSFDCVNQFVSKNSLCTKLRMKAEFLLWCEMQSEVNKSGLHRHCQTSRYPMRGIYWQLQLFSRY